MENQTTYSAYPLFGDDNNGFINRASLSFRKKIYNALDKRIDVSSLRNALDVGVTSDDQRLESNFFEAMFPDKNRLTALSDQDASWLEQRYPGLTFIRGDGRKMPFPDDNFDLVFSHAVLEHVGLAAQQEQFIRECLRVSRRYVLLTTPNRWHPVDFHTTIPFLHWLPKKLHRHILNRLGFEQLSRPENLNLLSRRDVSAMQDGIAPPQGDVFTINFLGFPAYILLFMMKG